MKFKNLYKILFSALFIFFISCDRDDATAADLSDFVGFELPKTYDLEKDATVTIPVTVHASNAHSQDRTFQIAVDPTVTTLSSSLYTLPSTVTIPANSMSGVINLTVTATDLGLSTGKKIKIYFPQQSGLNQSTSHTQPNAAGEFQVLSRGITLTLIEECLFTKVRLNILFDGYPDETSWELYDSSNNLIESGGYGPSGNVVGYSGTSFTTFLCLPTGSYTFIIYDTWGDGLSFPNDGSYSLSLLDGTVLLSGGGNFGSFSVHPFTIN